MTKQINKLPPNDENLTLEQLNDYFTPLSFKERLTALYQLFATEDVLLTSSFGTSSVFLLHLVHQIHPQQPVHFIDTGFHFPETIAYKEQLRELLNIRVIDLRPESTANVESQRKELWKTDIEQCCRINKLGPIAKVREQHKVWISGVMGYQTPHRAHLKIFEKQGNILKFHPLVDIDEGEFLFHMAFFDLPEHPLAKFGYGSVGCTYCTTKGKGRAGRWKGLTKTECGLHTDYFEKQNLKKG